MRRFEEFAALTLFFIVFLYSPVMPASQAANRLIVAQSLQEFQPIGVESCDHLTRMDTHFPMELTNIAELKACLVEIVDSELVILTRQAEDGTAEHMEALANLRIWQGLLIYWIAQLDMHDELANIYFAAGNLYHAINLLKESNAALPVRMKAAILGLGFRARGQFFSDKDQYQKAYQDLKDIHKLFAEDHENLAGEERIALRAYSSYWLGLLASQVSVFGQAGEAGRYTGYTAMRTAYEDALDNNASLAYLLSLYFSFGFVFDKVEPPDLYTQGQFAELIDAAAIKAGNDEVLIWNLIQQARGELFNVRSVGDPSYEAAEKLLTKAEALSEARQYRQYQVDVAVLRIQLVMKFDDHAQAAVIIEEQMSILNYMNELAVQQSPEMQFWANRFFQLVDYFGWVLVKSGDLAAAEEFFSSLPIESLPSAALNLSALYIQNEKYREAIDVLSSISETDQAAHSSIYRHNLTLAKHLSGDIDGAIDELPAETDATELEIAYKVALYAYKDDPVKAISLIKQHGGAGFSQLSNALMKTFLEIYRQDTQSAGKGVIRNTPAPVFSFLGNPLWLSSDFEKSGMPHFQVINSDSPENQASLVTGNWDGTGFSSVRLSENGTYSALAAGNIITLWDNSAGLPFRQLTEADSVEDMLFVHGDSQLLVSANNSLNLWDLKKGEIVISLPTGICWQCRIEYRKKTDSVIFKNPYDSLVEVNILNPSENVEIEAVENGSVLALDDQDSRLFFVESIVDPEDPWKTNVPRRLVSYDLDKKKVLGSSPVLSGRIENGWYSPANKQFILLQNMNAGAGVVKMRLSLWDTDKGLTKIRHFKFDSRVDVLGEIRGGSQLLLRTYDGNVILDLKSKKIKAILGSEDRQIQVLSPDGQRGFVVDQDRRTLSVVSSPDLKTLADIKPLDSDPGMAFYDEDKQVLMVASNMGRLHVWDMNTGQESMRSEPHPFLFPANGQQRPIAIVDDLNTYRPEENRWAFIERGQLAQKTFTVPPEVLSSKSNYDLQVVESPTHLYFSAWEEYGNKERSIWRSDHDFENPQMLSWTLESEDIIAIVEKQQLAISTADDIVFVRGLKDGSIQHEISEEDEYGNIKTMTPGWVDQQNETIWLWLGQELKGYDFSGSLKHHFTDEIGSLGPVSGNDEAPYFIITYEIAGSTLIRKIDRQTGEVLSNEILFDRTVTDINLSSKNNYLLVTTAEGSIDFWSLQEDKVLFSMYMLPDDNWVVTDPKGRFDTNNPGELDFMAWRLPEEPMKAYPIDIFLRDFFEPRLIPRLLNDAPFAAIPDLNTINRWQPKVTVSSIEQDTDGRLEIAVDLEQGGWAKPEQAKAYDLRLFRDGQQVAVYPQDHGEVIFEQGKKTVVFKDIALPNLQQGEPLEFTAMAFNSDGVKSRTARGSYTQQSPMSEVPARAYVLNVGIDHYSDESWNLAFAGNDADLLSTNLTEALENSGEFESVATQKLITAKTGLIDKTDVKSALVSLVEEDGSSMLSRSTPNDTIFMTWSGHGYVDDDGEFYLLTSQVGSDNRDMESVLEGAVSATQLSRWVEAIDAGRFILVIDACYSAAAVGAGEFKPGPMGSKGFGQLAWYKGMQILTASQANDVALESADLEHGLLTYALVIDGLVAQRADYLPEDGRVTAREWLKFGQQRVPEVYRGVQSGDSSIFKTKGGFQASEMPVVEKVQLPALFDFYRGNKVVEMPANQ